MDPEAVGHLIGVALVIAAFLAALALTIWIVGKILEALGRFARAVAPYILALVAVVVIYNLFQADAANATTLSVPSGVLIGATRAALVGF